MMWLLKLLGVDPLGRIIDGLNRAHEAKLTAENDSDRIRADVQIKRYESLLEQHKTAADVVKAGMQHRAFWLAWLIAALPTATWYGWGMADSLFDGSLPDVAELPPQLKAYADIVFGNIFYAGGAVAGFDLVAKVMGAKK